MAQTVELRQTSVPVGILNQTSSVTMGTVATTLTAPETSGNFTFCHWTLNANRWADLSVGAENPARFTVAGAVDAVAVYVPTTADTDTDGLPDWWEYRYLGTLNEDGTTNPDGDPLINSDEYARNLHPGVHNLHDHGGASRRRTIITVIQNQSTFCLLTELSDPAGVINQTRIVSKNVPITLATPPASTLGYYFTGWLLNGARFDRPTDYQPIIVTPIGDLTLVARYTLGTQDSDGDGLVDWKELLWFDSLQYDTTSDPDGDGFSIAGEETRGFSSLAADTLVQGGVSRRRSPSVLFDSTGKLPFRLASDPATILDQLDYYPTGSWINVPNKDGHSYGGYQFSWWDLNGARQQDASGAALPAFGFTLNAPVTATAHYVDPNLDSDDDGIKDWHEWTYFGSLMYDSTSDTDGDGFSYAAELGRSQAPQVADVLAQGGVSRRRSPAIFVDTTGRLSYRTTSNPTSILSDQQYLPRGTFLTVADKTGHSYANYQFSCWTLNGVRQEDASGVGLGGFTFTLNVAADLVGNYFDPNVDTDSDGIKDWHEWTYYGTLANGPTNDTDTDGFTYAEELARSQSPRVLDVLEPGGVSRRRGPTVTIDPVVLASAPEVGELQATNITATTATISARINPLSSATTARFEYGPTPALGQTVDSVSILNGFIADSMSAPLTGLLPDTLYYYLVNATNSSGTTVSGVATFRTLGTRTGYQQWALIYSITNPNGDVDMDGVPNLAEYAFGMHPRLYDLWKQPLIEIIDGRFRLTVTAPASVNDVIYGAEYSNDLTSWAAMSDSGISSFHEFLTPLDQVGQPKVFVRWSIRIAVP